MNSETEWSPRRLRDLIALVKGTSYKSAELEGDDGLVGIKCVSSGGGFKASGIKPFSGRRKVTQELRPGDLVVALTDLTQNGDVLGRPAVVPSTPFPSLVGSLDVGKVVVRDSSLDIRFLHHLLRAPTYGGWAKGHATGTTVRHLKPGAILDFAFPLPPLDEQRRVAAVLDVLDEKIELDDLLAARLEEMLAVIFAEVSSRAELATEVETSTLGEQVKPESTVSVARFRPVQNP